MADSNERVTTALDWYVGVQFPGAANAEQACVRGFAFCGVIGGYTACEVFRSTPTAWRKQAVAEPASVTRSPPFEVSPTTYSRVCERQILVHRRGVWIVIGVVDESTPFDVDGRVVYAVAVVLVAFEDRQMVQSSIERSFDRRRPFHWERDRGGDVRARMLELLTSVPVEIVVAATRCETRRQTGARERLFDEVIFPAVVGRVTSFVIERRSRAENERDGRVIRDWFRPTPQRIPSYDHVDKTDPLTWLADAASGIWSDALLNRGAGNLERLIGSGRLTLARILR